MTLIEKQNLFAQDICKLIPKAKELGFLVTLGEAWRPQVTADYYAAHNMGIKNSVHELRLALDINLFIDAHYITDGAAYQPLGEYWESLSTQDAQHCWGGRWGDCVHFSIENEGVK